MNTFLTKAFLALTLSVGAVSYAQEAKPKMQTEREKLPKPYKPEDDAKKKINELVSLAKKEKKNIILQAGGNWCIWCLRFDNFVKTTPRLKKLVDDNYLYYHLNYSKENKNVETFKKYGDPGSKYGYPVFLVLDSNGKLLHTQESSGFESGKGYDEDKVAAFFNKWTYRK